MKYFRSLLTLCVSLAMLPNLSNAEEILQVPGKMFNAEQESLQTFPPSLRLPPVTLPKRAGRGVTATAAPSVSEVVLPELSVTELQQIQAAGEEKNTRVGLGRGLPETLSAVSAWQWNAVAGGMVAHMKLTSTNAKRIRVLLRMGELPQGAELRFYAPQDLANVMGPYDQAAMQTQPKDTDNKTLFWSPSIEGDTLGMEVFLPNTAQVSDLDMRIERLSHVVIDPISGEVQESYLKATTPADPFACQIDVACEASPGLQIQSKAVAGYFFTTELGETSFCTGTLLNNYSDDGTPYFLTANHCINDEKKSASMEFSWFFASSGCNTNDGNTLIKRTYLGSQLLAKRPDADSTLLQLNQAPPAGVVFSGWSANGMPPASAVAGIHHSGFASLVLNAVITWPQKYSQGYVIGNGRNPLDEQTTTTLPFDSEGEFAYVQWTKGVALAGGSGSALLMQDKGNYFVTGVLLGGRSSCDNPTGIDYYGRLDKAFVTFKPWLTKRR